MCDVLSPDDYIKQQKGYGIHRCGDIESGAQAGLVTFHFDQFQSTLCELTLRI